jgi:hypothetical protein
VARFGEVAGRFWDSESTYLRHAPLTAEARRDAEAKLRVSLPPDYIKLLERQNGGRVNRDFAAFPTPTPTSWAADHVPFRECFGIGEGFGSITESPSLNAEWAQPRELVLLSGDGHWWIALDYREAGRVEPTVVWYDNEVGQDLTLASTFRDFIEGLRPLHGFTA